MTNTPLNPDGVLAAAQSFEITGINQPHLPIARAAVSAYLAAAQPVTVQLVTIKLPKNPDHNPREKLTNTCAVSPECTDSTGEHHTVAVYTDDEVDALRIRFGHITRIERVSITVAQPVVNSVEELDALPLGTVIQDSDGGCILQALERGSIMGTEWYVPGVEEIYTSASVELPARVLYRPGDKP